MFTENHLRGRPEEAADRVSTEAKAQRRMGQRKHVDVCLMKTALMSTGLIYHVEKNTSGRDGVSKLWTEPSL